jgi:hypothetical protein
MLTCISQFIQLGEVFYILTTTFLKISLGLFFLRVLTKRWQHQTFYVILFISGLYGLTFLLITIFECGSPANLADRFIGSDKCAPAWFLLAAGYLYGIINVIADWSFTLIPIVLLMDSEMDLRSKISISIVMGFAAVGSIASILRMVYLEGLHYRGQLSRTCGINGRSSGANQYKQPLLSRPPSGQQPSQAWA